MIPCPVSCVTFNAQSNYEQMKGGHFVGVLYVACDVFRKVLSTAVN